VKMSLGNYPQLIRVNLLKAYGRSRYTSKTLYATGYEMLWDGELVSKFLPCADDEYFSSMSYGSTVDVILDMLCLSEKEFRKLYEDVKWGWESYSFELKDEKEDD
jgi:hypothetical protein